MHLAHGYVVFRPISQATYRLLGISVPAPAGNGLKTLAPAPYIFVRTFYQSKLEKT